MTDAEARRFINDYYYSPNPGEEEKFLFEEGMLYLIDKYHNPQHMSDLAFFYLEQRRHDLELKYLEMAAEYNYPTAVEELGFIWYYGQTGVVDYEKAYGYFLRGQELDDDVVRSWSECKLADMYHNGYYVEKDEARYKKMIESLYAYCTNPGKMKSVYHYPERCLPHSEVGVRLARIRAEEGRVDEAAALLHDTRIRLGEAIRNNPTWWGNIEVMDQVVTLEYKIGAAGAGVSRKLDIYDIFWMCERECTVAFLYGRRRFLIEVVADETSDGEVIKNVIKFDGKWFRTAREFLEKAEIDGKKLTVLYDALQDMEVNYG